jgi:hypothetical protein
MNNTDKSSNVKDVVAKLERLREDVASGRLAERLQERPEAEKKQEAPKLSQRVDAWVFLVMGILAFIGLLSLGDAIDHWRGKIPTCERINSARERVKSLEFQLSEASTEIHHTQTTEDDKEILFERIRKLKHELSSLDTHLQQCNCPE